MDQAVSSIAKLMGIEDLRPGRHILRDAKQVRTGELTIVEAWYVNVCPTFHDWGVVAVARAVDTEFRGSVTKGFLRAGIAVTNMKTESLRQTVVADIQHDPLPSSLQSLDMFASSDSFSLDGISYEFMYSDTRLSDEHPICQPNSRGFAAS